MAWVYASEVVQDSAFGVCILAQMSGILFNSLTAEFLFSSFLQSYGVFTLFAVMSLVGTLYIQLYIVETKHLSEK